MIQTCLDWVCRELGVANPERDPAVLSRLESGDAPTVVPGAKRVDDPQVGDVVVFRSSDWHAGLLREGGIVEHMIPGSGLRRTPLGRIRKAVWGYWRPDTPCA